MATFTGTTADDNLYGSTEPDDMYGGDGDDSLCGHDNDDTLFGGDGADLLDGGEGDDTLYGGDDGDTDVMYGGSGNDNLHAQGGDTADGGTEDNGTLPDHDALYVDSLIHLCDLKPDAEGNGYDGKVILKDGSIVTFMNIGLLYVNNVLTPWPDFIVEGSEDADEIGESYKDDPEGDMINHEDNELCNNDDVVEAYGGDDVVKSGDGNDTIYAGTGNDTVFGGDHTDIVFGESGNDTLHGDAGNDTIEGGSGNDTLYGGANDDLIDGGTGNDTIYGGTGADDITGGADNDLLFGEDGDDTIDGESGEDQIEGGAGADMLSGGLGKDTIEGGTGADTLKGEEGDDLLFGGAGDDDIWGGENNDVAYGGADNDSIDLNEGNDVGIGGFGDDTIMGGAGNDCLFGDEPVSVTINPGAVQGQGNGGSETGDVTGMPTNDFTLEMQFSGENVPAPAIYDGVDDDGNEATPNLPPASYTPNTTTLLNYGTDTQPGALTIYAQSDVQYYTYPQPNEQGAGDTNDDSTITIPGYLVVEVVTEGGTVETLVTDIPSSTLLDGSNTSLAATFSGDEIVLYVNGVEHVTPFNADADFDLPADGNFTFGNNGTGNNGAGDNGFTGQFTDIRLWDDLRDASEIAEFHDTDLDDEAGDANLVSNWVPNPFNPGGFIDTPGGNNSNGSGSTQFNSEGNGSDTLSGGEGDDKLFGAAGDDTLSGDIGDDLLYAGIDADVDRIDGGDDRDFIYAGALDQVKGGQAGDDYDTLDVSSHIVSGGYALLDTDTVVSDTESGGNGNGQDGTINFYDENNNFTGALNFEDIENLVGLAPCFTPGTMILTPKGDVKVENLQIGDRVKTRDNGYQTIEWVGRKVVSKVDLAITPALQPILIEPGALGHNTPTVETIVSPQHRMVVGNAATQLWFGEDEVLVAALHLTCLDGVTQLAVDEVEYIHIMFAQHEIVFSNGAWSESFQPGDMVLGALDSDARSELLVLFPELANPSGMQHFAAARQTLKRYEVQLALS